ncbi:uncharacterized protein [Malus domestica]|uniref:uncharacterized protein n=1 Tax=Malus domestica TaxID=3750 RepID=UPI0039760945
MCRGQQDVSSAISSESEHIISVRKTSRFANKSGKNVVSALDHATNSIEKTDHNQNDNFINRGQAFFQRNRAEKMDSFLWRTCCSLRRHFRTSFQYLLKKHGGKQAVWEYPFVVAWE